MKILILNADTNAGRAITQSLGARGHRCCVAAVDTRHPTFSSRYASWRAIHPDPLADKRAFGAWVLAQQRQHVFDLVIPATEETLVPLHELRSEPTVRAAGPCRLDDVCALPDAESVDAVFDKERLRERAVSLGVSTPGTVLVQRESDLDDPRIEEWLREGRVVAKTVRSKVWDGEHGASYPARILTRRDELEAHVAPLLARTAVQVQEWVPGHGVGVGLLAHRGDVVLSVAYERVHEVPLTGGASSYRRTIAPTPGLIGDSARLMGAFGWHGVAMVEFRVDPESGRHWLMEINGRFWGSLPLAIFAGADFPQALAEMVALGRLPDRAAVRTGVSARNVRLDIVWTKAMVKKHASRPSALARELLPSFLEWGRIWSDRETWDGASLRDPGPIARELYDCVAGEVATVGRKLARQLLLRRTRRTSIERSKRSPTPSRVLVLCYGNICRSPYAHARLEEWNHGRSVSVRSRGFHPRTGRQTPDSVQRAAARRGVDLSRHRSALVTQADLEWAEVIVVMDERNYADLKNMDARSLEKAIWLGAFDGDARVEIEDPYDLAGPEVDAVFTRMDRCLERFQSTGSPAVVHPG